MSFSDTQGVGRDLCAVSLSDTQEKERDLCAVSLSDTQGRVETSAQSTPPPPYVHPPPYHTPVHPSTSRVHLTHRCTHGAGRYTRTGSTLRREEALGSNLKTSLAQRLLCLFLNFLVQRDGRVGDSVSDVQASKRKRSDRHR